MMKNFHQSEQGSVGAKFIIVLVLLLLVANGLYNYIPAMYNAESLRQEVKAAVMQSTIVPPTTGTAIDVTKKRIFNLAKAKETPDNTFIEVKQINNLLQARVAFTKQIAILPFGLYNYQYQFDYTAKANGDILQ